MVGYSESLTDPSYEGQILVLTYPLIGNYGVPARAIEQINTLPDDFESSRIHVAALVVAYYSEDFSHFLAASSLGQWLKDNGVPAICGIDTRALTKKIREQGSTLGKLLAKRSTSNIHVPSRSLATDNKGRSEESRSHTRPPSPKPHNPWAEEYFDVPFHDPNVENLVDIVSIRQPTLYAPTKTSRLLHPSGRPLRVIAIDVGMKYNQIRCFTNRGVEVKVVPWD